MTTRPDPVQAAALPQALEAFARDLLILVRTSRLYPPDHPSFRTVGERLVDRVFRELPDPLSVGVTPDQLVVGDVFVGEEGSRAGALARWLHGRKVVRLLWTREASPEDVLALAGVLADRTLSGADLGRALRDRGVHTLDPEPLDLGRLQTTFRPFEPSAAPSGEPRGREAWLWLIREGPTADTLLGALGDPELWSALGEASESQHRAAVVRVLLGAGDRLTRALTRLPPAGRERAERGLEDVGRGLDPEILAGLLRDEMGGGGSREGLDLLTRGLGTGRLVDLLAGLVHLEGRDTARFSDVLRRFAPGGAGVLLPLVRARLARSDPANFGEEVWRTLEKVLLDLDETPFMGDGYRASLEKLSATGPSTVATRAGTDLGDDPEPHLDRLLVGLVRGGAPGDLARLTRRFEARVEALPLPEVLNFADRVSEVVSPGAGGGAPQVRAAFREGLARVRVLTRQERERFLRFSRRHEGVLLEPALRALLLESRISARRLLVEFLAGVSSRSVPALVARARAGPWYVSRNLALVLGMRGDDRAVPVLETLGRHEHEKVRHEAISALGRIGSPRARGALDALDKTPGAGRADRCLVHAALGRGGEG